MSVLLPFSEELTSGDSDSFCGISAIGYEYEGKSEELRIAGTCGLLSLPFFRFICGL